MSTRKILLGLVAAAALGACSHRPHHGGGGYGGGPNPFMPQISIDGNNIRTDQDILVFPRGSRDPVTFSLPSDSPYRFGKDSIVIEGRVTDQLIKGERTAVVVDTGRRNNTFCTPSDKGLQITCDRSKAEPGVYKYTIRLRRGESVALERDPMWIEQ